MVKKLEFRWPGSEIFNLVLNPKNEGTGFNEVCRGEPEAGIKERAFVDNSPKTDSWSGPGLDDRLEFPCRNVRDPPMECDFTAIVILAGWAIGRQAAAAKKFVETVKPTNPASPMRVDKAGMDWAGTDR